MALHTVPTAHDTFRFDEISVAFDAEPTSSHAPVGDYQARIVAVAVINRLPRWLGNLITPLVARVTGTIWMGKRLTPGGSGSNLWFSWSRPRQYGDFTHSSTAGRARLDYAVDSNPALLRAFRGEITTIGPEILLGRMTFRVKNREMTVLYFTLER
ncbi:hypothetical protein [Williamsia maris]|uniref:Uncharacterized protein n=1 Tax=Williamsia maris TaxID=72806 RepID=A0ABT1HJH0_9NOCA|nr:hypothetical protein [Williamsia maris]MCP2178072.1 hypothetical protein [Williamsia maris]